MDADSRAPNALERLTSVIQSIGGRVPVFFVDFDGTLVPIASEPEQAAITSEMKRILDALAQRYAVCVASGRGLADLRRKVGLRTIFYAADHGYRVVGPEGTDIDFEVIPENPEALENASYTLEGRLRDVPGAIVETKNVSLSVHYRQVDPSLRAFVEQTAAEVAEATPGLRLACGKEVCELLPETAWDKGKAVVWILRRLRHTRGDSCPVCLGDDLTDENMFRAVQGWGVTIVVGNSGRTSLADFSLEDSEEVGAFLETFLGRVKPS